ncbi:MAG: hypothetical protein U0Q12_10685 [Vicinamibacterales bacterium]
MAFVLGVLAAACGPKLVALPTRGERLPDAARVLDTATSACAGVRTLSAELALAGRAAGHKLRGRVHVGFATPDRMRLEGVAPFGPPAFVLAASGGRATLLFPRDDRVLSDASPADVVDALAGIALGPDALKALLTGCVSPTLEVSRAERFPNGWIRAVLGDGTTTVYTNRDRIVAGEVGAWRVDYTLGAGAFPPRLRLTTRDVSGAASTDLAVDISQLDTNVTLDDDAFTVAIPGGATAITLDEVRRLGPLGPAS